MAKSLFSLYLPTFSHTGARGVLEWGRKAGIVVRQNRRHWERQIFPLFHLFFFHVLLIWKFWSLRRFLEILKVSQDSEGFWGFWRFLTIPNCLIKTSYLLHVYTRHAARLSKNGPFFIKISYLLHVYPRHAARLSKNGHFFIKISYLLHVYTRHAARLSKNGRIWWPKMIGFLTKSGRLARGSAKF